jgi:hypothetical protein
MALRDKSCYTLTIQPSASQPGVTELIEFLVDGSPTSQAQYARLREDREGESYSSIIFGMVFSSYLETFQLIRARRF